MNIKSKEKISFDEFKAWVNGLLYGKGRAVPDADDWKEIKNMLEKVVPDVVEMQNPETPFFPTLPQPQVVPYVTPNTPEVEPWKPPFPVTCGSDKIADSLTSSNSNYGGFAGFGIAAGYENNIKECGELTGQMAVGSFGDSYGITNISESSGTILPCPSVFVEQEGTPEESLTALEKAQVLLKKFKDTE